MARCTLDDLVPRFKCNRIFLEPLQGNYNEYEVQIDASVYDIIDDEDGIADYLFSDSFKQYINILVVFCRSTAMNNLRTRKHNFDKANPSKI